MPKETVVAIFPNLVALLAAESNVVHSYAATAIDRLLALKDDGQPRFAMAALAPLLQQLLERLFAAFAMPESAENEYLMRCVMRVISFVGPEVGAVVRRG